MPNPKHTGADGTSGPGAGERAPASKRSLPDKSTGAKPPKSEPFDPASRPDGGPSLAAQEQRTFHATHFTADPRGSAMAGAPPGGSRRKQRGGSPPNNAAARNKPSKPKRRGGAGPE